MGNTTEAVRAAKNPLEAMLALAAALDKLLEEPQPDGWSAWSVFQGGNQMTAITGDESHTEVQLPPVSEEQKQRRRAFEQQYLKLGEYLDGDEDWNAAYAEGGPQWLYYGNRELFISYPDQVKQAMINDIISISPEEAHEIGRDALKVWESGPGNGMQIDESVAPAKG